MVADVRAPRDGRFIERVGSFDPLKDKSDESATRFIKTPDDDMEH